MGLTGSGTIVAMWIFIWCFAKFFSTRTRGSEFLIFWLGIFLFYPVTSTAYTDLHVTTVVRATVLILFALSYLNGMRAGLSQSSFLRIVYMSWIGWGLMAYLPVLSTWLAQSLFNVSLPDLFGLVLYIESSTLKTSVWIIVSVFAALIPMVALKETEDWRVLHKAIAAGLTILLVLSFLQVLMGTRFIPTEYEDYGGRRLGGFSHPDANGHGRLLLMPLLCLIGLMMSGTKVRGLWSWPAVILGIASILLTVSRTTYISFSLGVIIMMLLNVRSAKDFVMPAAVAVATMALIFATGTIERFSADSDRMSLANLYTRIELYEAVFDLLSANPWFGTLPGGFREGMFQAGFIGELFSAHNMFMFIATEWGIPMGLVLIAALFGAVFYGLRAVKVAKRLKQRSEGIMLAASMAKSAVAIACAFFVSGLTDNCPPDFVFTVLGFSLASWVYLRRCALSNSAPHVAG